MTYQQAYFNDQKLKDSLVKRMDNHIKADNLLQKATGQDGKGCTVWCALNNGDLKEGYNHKAFETILGLPEWLAKLQDKIFEGLLVEDAKSFSSEWPKAIPVGANLEPVRWKLCAFILQRNIERVLSLDISDELKEQVVKAIRQVLAVHENAIVSGWDEIAASSAAESAAESAESSAAESAAWSAAWSAESSAWSAAWSAANSAWSSARSAESSAWSAAWSAWSAESSAAESAEYKIYADKLIELLKTSI